MVIFGIDPGTTTTGFGVIKKINVSTFALIDHGVIKTKPKLRQNLKLKEIYKDLSIALSHYKPDIVSIERVFYNTNPKTVIAVSEARGVCLLAATHAKIKIKEFTPLQVKSNIVGYGRADKDQVSYMVKKLLNLQTLPKPDDAADALALALCAALL
jgi:crossover junction endodeoxyribonuclease RuvC